MPVPVSDIFSLPIVSLVALGRFISSTANLQVTILAFATILRSFFPGLISFIQVVSRKRCIQSETAISESAVVNLCSSAWEKRRIWLQTSLKLLPGLLLHGAEVALALVSAPAPSVLRERTFTRLYSHLTKLLHPHPAALTLVLVSALPSSFLRTT